MKARCKHRGRPSAQSSRLARREMNHLNQKVPAQNGTTSSGVLHSRGTPTEEDNSKGHCRQGGSGGWIPADTHLLRRTPKLKRFLSLFAVLPSELQQEWSADHAGQRKRGRKPKVAPGVKSKGPHYKDDRPSERRKTTEEQSDSESSEHGEFWFARASMRVNSRTFIL